MFRVKATEAGVPAREDPLFSSLRRLVGLLLNAGS
jgi:hypothetical protein